MLLLSLWSSRPAICLNALLRPISVLDVMSKYGTSIGWRTAKILSRHLRQWEKQKAPRRFHNSARNEIRRHSWPIIISARLRLAALTTIYTPNQSNIWHNEWLKTCHSSWNLFNKNRVSEGLHLATSGDFSLEVLSRSKSICICFLNKRQKEKSFINGHVHESCIQWRQDEELVPGVNIAPSFLDRWWRSTKRTYFVYF